MSYTGSGAKRRRGGGPIPPPLFGKGLFSLSDSTHTKRIPLERVVHLHDLARTGIVNSCIDLISNYAVGGGVSLTRDGESVDELDADKVEMSTKVDLVTLARDAIKWALVVGMVPVVCEDADEPTPLVAAMARAHGANVTMGRVAYVPDTESIALVGHTNASGLRTRFQVMNGRDSSEIPDSFVAVLTKPEDEEIRSAVAATEGLVVFQGQMQQMTVEAERHRVRPCVITQERRKAPMDTSSLFFDSESRQIATEEESHADALNRQAMHISMAHERLVNMIQTRNLDYKHTTPPPAPDPKTFLSIPRGSEAGPQMAFPQTRGDIVQIREHVTQSVCAAFAVPPALITKSTSRHAGALTSMEIRSFNNTVSEMATWVSVNVLRPAFVLCYPELGKTIDVSLVPRQIVHPDEVGLGQAVGIPAHLLAEKVMLSMGFSQAVVDDTVEGMKAAASTPVSAPVPALQQRGAQSVAASSESGDEAGQ